MSVESIAIALHHSRAKGVTKLVLIGIANHDGDGGSWPSNVTLAKYAHCTPDNARKAVRQLEALGEIETVRNGGGLRDAPDHMRPNLYKFKLQCPPDCDRSTQHRTRRDSYIPSFQLSEMGDSPSAEQGTAHRLGGSPSAGWGAAAARDEPSLRTQTSKEPEVTTDTREPIAPLERCFGPGRRGRPHRYLDSGYCADCAQSNPHRMEESA